MAPRSGFAEEVAAEAATGAGKASVPSVRLHGAGGLVLPLGGYQAEELGLGGYGEGALEWGPSPVWGFQFVGGFAGLSKGSGAPPPGVAELDGASGIQLGLGARLRPFAPGHVGFSSGGIWLSASGGISITGGSTLPQLEGKLGYDWFVSRAIGIGPEIGLLHVFDSADGPRNGDANLFLVGLHLSYDFSPSVTAPKPKDSDADGLLDPVDQCPEKAEDRDGFEDADGCPDPDNDADGVLDTSDSCPDSPEDMDAFEDNDGCPDEDNDADGVPDESDKCANEPEDRDHFMDEDGCPEPDNDKDNISDAKDLCPNEPETLNGFSDNDGCPDEEHVRVVGDKIELDQKIHFWSDSAKLRAMSYPVLNKLAEFLVSHPEYVHVSIEGHADERGPDELNQKLSASRAESVMNFLGEKGVDASRMSFVGHGSSRPLVEGKSEYSWFMNRRVEFILTRESEIREELKKPVEAPETGGALGDGEKPHD